MLVECVEPVLGTRVTTVNRKKIRERHATLIEYSRKASVYLNRNLKDEPALGRSGSGDSLARRRNNKWKAKRQELESGRRLNG